MSDGTVTAYDLDGTHIKNWRSIVTLIVFILANAVVIYPFHVPVFVPKWLEDIFFGALISLRILPPSEDGAFSPRRVYRGWLRYQVPINFLTGPLAANLFLLAILAIGREEVAAGTIGTDSIHPIDIMLFFLTLAYIAISIDASGLIRYMAYRILHWGGKSGRRLFLLLYAFFFALGSFIGNDPIILSGTPFLAYMTRISVNIKEPKAWVYTQFAVANIASAILVSSNPTNLVLAGAFGIRFVDYTANMIVPVIITGIILFPFLLYVVFAKKELIPDSIERHEMPESLRNQEPINMNIPYAKRAIGEGGELGHGAPDQLASLTEIMNPYVDRKGAFFGAFIMAVTLVTLLAVNAAMSSTGKELPVFYITVPAAVLTLLIDMALGLKDRDKTILKAMEYRKKCEVARAQQSNDSNGRQSSLQERKDQASNDDALHSAPTGLDNTSSDAENSVQPLISGEKDAAKNPAVEPETSAKKPTEEGVPESELQRLSEKKGETRVELEKPQPPVVPPNDSSIEGSFPHRVTEAQSQDHKKPGAWAEPQQSNKRPRATTLVSLCRDAHYWARVSFPNAMTVLSQLPFALVPFAFCMFILVQALVSSGWVPIFAYGWDHWVARTGTVGAIGGMGFLAVVLSNFTGTNIGTSILLCRLIQAWLSIHREGLSEHAVITERTFWATVYSMAIGVNYGAFSTTLSASLAGLLWRDILERKYIKVSDREFALTNVPIIAVSMAVSCAVLVGQVYITRKDEPMGL